MSIVFHGIAARTSARAAHAPECKGCIGTLCKVCHGAEQEGAKDGAPAETWILRATSGFLGTRGDLDWRATPESSSSTLHFLGRECVAGLCCCDYAPSQRP